MTVTSPQSLSDLAASNGLTPQLFAQYNSIPTTTNLRPGQVKPECITLQVH